MAVLDETGDAGLLLDGVLRRVFAVREDLSVSAWAAKYRYVLNPSGAIVKWDNDLTPYSVEVMDAYSDDRVREISIMGGSQVSKTEPIYNMLFWTVHQQPGLTMFVYPDADSAKDQNRLRLTPNIHATPVVKALLGEKLRDQKTMSIRFVGMDLVMRGAGGKVQGRGEHKLESLPAPRVFNDEVDRCPPNTSHLLRQRTKTFANGKLVKAGKPGFEGQGIDAEYAASDQRRYNVPCPHCGIYHVRTFNRVRWWGKQANGTTGPDSRDSQTSVFKATQSAWFKCPNRECLGTIGAEFNRWQLRMGRWAARGQTVGPLTKATDAAEWQNPCEQWTGDKGELIGEAPETDHVGFHISGLMSGLVTNPYSESAAGFCRRKGIIDQDFVCDQLGEAWRVKGDKIDDTKLSLAAVNSGYRLGQVPAGVLALVAGVDVQADAAWVTVRGFGDRGTDRWLVWRGRVPCPTNLAPLGAQLDLLRFARTDGTPITLGATFIDSGHRTKEVYDLCRSRKRCWPVKGMATMSGPHRISRLDKWPDGTEMVGGIRLLVVNTHHWKQEVTRRLRAELPADADPRQVGDVDAGEELGSFTLGAEVKAGRWWFPEDTGDEYFSQITSEECRTKTRGTEVTHEWTLRPGRSNHYFDGEVYIEAGFDAIGGPVTLKAPVVSATAPVVRRKVEHSSPRSAMAQIARDRPSLVNRTRNGE